MRWLLTGAAAAAFVLGAVGAAAAGRGNSHSGGSHGDILNKPPVLKTPGNNTPDPTKKSGIDMPKPGTDPKKLTPPPGKPTDGKVKPDKDYPAKWGKRFGDGWCYPGRDHHHWTCHFYWERYGCTCYYCPHTYCWYYWCEPACCYYPVSYIATEPPVVKTAQTPPPKPGGLPAFGPDGTPLTR